MRKNFLMGLGLAATLAGVAAAQQPGADTPRQGREDHRGRGGELEGRGGAGGFLLKGITLSDAQKTQLKQLRESRRAQGEANQDQWKKQRDDVKAARQRGDTAAVRNIMQQNRQAMTQRREQDIAAIRNILTADQRVQFDKNVAELKQREQERGQNSGRRARGNGAGQGFGRGLRGAKGGK